MSTADAGNRIFKNIAVLNIAADLSLIHISHNVILPGYVKGPVIEGAYAGADCFFFPSKEETEGIVVLEALASSQQVLLRDIPVYDPWLLHGVNCYKGKTVADFVDLTEKKMCIRDSLGSKLKC